MDLSYIADFTPKYISRLKRKAVTFHYIMVRSFTTNPRDPSIQAVNTNRYNS